MKAHTGTSPAGFLNAANSYFLSAQILQIAAGDSDKSPPPFSYLPRLLLIQHGWELALKAFLRASGTSEALLSGPKYGHRLGSLLTESEKFGLRNSFDFSDDGKKLFDALDRAIERHETRYPNLNTPRIIEMDASPLIDDGLRFYRVFISELSNVAAGRSWV